MDTGGCSKINEQERRGSMRVWTKEEEEALLNIMDEIIAAGGRADFGSFKAGTLRSIEVRLANVLPNYANISGKDCATGKTTYTPENLAIDLDVDDNFDNEFDQMLENFSSISINQTDSNQ
ncbi:hypothetical protein JRO89_XS12G0226800 [Xanthoceras sorbifolium]|uniref:Myb-like domain-containing protein n=1 Tax=Xanthoceras sorbifolium TaxID=99658 RepID=A0ABQ8HDB5_9ROSI|nr:hypothetical protein JRO89_XS12G0226800 [Xanthoceras sorbifolium]